MIFMAQGIYGYWDKEKMKFRYIGKDSYIDKNMRDSQHFSPSTYYDQSINMVLQDNPERFEYRVLIEGNYSDEDLNKLEAFYIKYFGTYEDNDGLNCTPCGDGKRRTEIDLDIDSIIDWYVNKNRPIWRIAVKFDVSERVIRNVLLDNGVELSTKKNLDIDSIIDMRINQKMRIKDIARKFKVSEMTIRNRLKDNTY